MCEQIIQPRFETAQHKNEIAEPTVARTPRPECSLGTSSGWQAALTGQNSTCSLQKHAKQPGTVEIGIVSTDNAPPGTRKRL